MNVVVYGVYDHVLQVMKEILVHVVLTGIVISVPGLAQDLTMD